MYIPGLTSAIRQRSIMAPTYFSAFFPTTSSTSSTVKVPLHSVRPLARISSFSSRSEVCSNLKTMVE